MAFNISTLAATDTTFVHLAHPASGELLMDGDTKVGITMWGRASKQFQKALSISDKKEQQSKIKNKSVEAKQAEGAKFLADITVSIAGLADEDGSLINSPAMYEKLYKDPRFYWINDQVNTALAEDSNFIQR